MSCRSPLPSRRTRWSAGVEARKGRRWIGFATGACGIGSMGGQVGCSGSGLSIGLVGRVWGLCLDRFRTHTRASALDDDNGAQTANTTTTANKRAHRSSIVGKTHRTRGVAGTRMRSAACRTTGTIATSLRGETSLVSESGRDTSGLVGIGTACLSGGGAGFGSL